MGCSVPSTDAFVTIEEAAREVFDASCTTYLQGSPVLDPNYVLEGFYDYKP